MSRLTVTQATYRQINGYLDDSSFEFEHEPASYVCEPMIHRTDTHLVVGYLVHDDDCTNPLDNDGMGQVWDRTRNGQRDADEHVFKALALDRHGEPDFDLIWDEVQAEWESYIKGKPIEFWEEFVGHLTLRSDFPTLPRSFPVSRREFACYWMEELMDAQVDPGDTAYLLVRFAAKYIGADDSSEDQLRAAADMLYFTADEVAERIWKEARAKGRIGDPFAVMLDVYDHSGRMWSISGEGTQCRWDTSRGAGMWIPDDELRGVLEERAKVACWAYVRETPIRLKGKDNKYQLIEVSWNEAGPVHADLGGIEFSDDWHALYQKAKQIAADKPEPTGVQLNWARGVVAEEFCRGILEEYNAWLNGDCYGTVVQFFNNTGTTDEPVWEQEDSDACWGFIGSEYAEQELKASFDSVVNRLPIVTSE